MLKNIRYLHNVVISWWLLKCPQHKFHFAKNDLNNWKTPINQYLCQDINDISVFYVLMLFRTFSYTWHNCCYKLYQQLDNFLITNNFNIVLSFYHKHSESSILSISIQDNSDNRLMARYLEQSNRCILIGKHSFIFLYIIFIKIGWICLRR